MATLTTGAVAPDFALPTMQGGTIKLREALKHGAVLVVFFKISCPVCQFALPYVERIHEQFGDRRVTVLGISQNAEADTKQFMEQYGITFPVLLDERGSYPVSNAYGLTNVPTLFYVAQDGSVERSIVGWSRSDMSELSHRIAEIAGVAPVAIFNPGEDVPEFKAG